MLKTCKSVIQIARAVLIKHHAPPLQWQRQTAHGKKMQPTGFPKYLLH